MEERFKTYGYEITTDTDFMNEQSGITPELQRQMDSLYHKAKKGGEKNIQYLIKQIEKHPTVPNLKNYLSVAYMNSNKKEKSIEVNNWILTEHPDYLFGLLNKANIHYLDGEYDKMPEVLGEEMEIQALYPDRDVFHISEVISFYKSAIMYFSAINNVEATKSRFEIMEDLAPDHPDTKLAFNILIATRMKSAQSRFEEEEKTRITPQFLSYDKSKQNKKAPDFNHHEINELYRNDIEIDRDILKHILSLPRETLIIDLKNVLKDSICRFEYFKSLEEKNEINYTQLTFPIHAIFLLGELEANDAITDILDTFCQGEEFIRFWYGDYITDSFWEPLYKLAENNMEQFKEFMFKSGVYTYAKSEVSTAVTQFYFHHFEQRDKILNWYDSILNHYLTSKQDNLIDTDLIGLMICEIMEADLKELIPVIEKLYDKGFVAQGICGSFKEVKKDFGDRKISYHKKDILSIYDRYLYIENNWYSYNNEEQDQLFDSNKQNEITYERNEAKIGRNDPCPCGSGKKYKKCCINKTND